VRLVVSDPVEIPGHAEWVSRTDFKDAMRGFSMGVKNGKVQWLFPSSGLNPTTDAIIEESYVRDLRRLFPLRDDFKVLLN